MSPLNITQPLDSIRYMVYNGYYKVMSILIHSFFRQKITPIGSPGKRSPSRAMKIRRSSPSIFATLVSRRDRMRTACSDRLASAPPGDGALAGKNGGFTMVSPWKMVEPWKPWGFEMLWDGLSIKHGDLLAMYENLVGKTSKTWWLRGFTGLVLLEICGWNWVVLVWKKKTWRGSALDCSNHQSVRRLSGDFLSWFFLIYPLVILQYLTYPWYN